MQLHLLLPRLRNETAAASPVWGEPRPEAAAMARGVPVVSTTAAAPSLFRAPRGGADSSTCGFALGDDVAGFARAAAALLDVASWEKQSRLASSCARTRLTPAEVDLAWTEVLAEALS